MTTLVVLAAGLATRYGGVKQLESVGPNGERLFDYAVADALAAGVDDVVFVIRPELREIFERDVIPGIPARLAEQRSERAKPWGTAHALLAAVPFIEGDMLVCNADDWYGRSAYARVHGALNADADTHVVGGYRLAGTLSEHGAVTRAILRTDAHDILQSIEETSGLTDAGDNPLVSMNLWGFHRSFLPLLKQGVGDFLANPDAEELPIPVLINKLLPELPVRVVPVEEQWFGMTHSADLHRVRQMIAARFSSNASTSSSLV